jgi:hypothetical protein
MIRIQIQHDFNTLQKRIPNLSIRLFLFTVTYFFFPFYTIWIWRVFIHALYTDPPIQQNIIFRMVWILCILGTLYGLLYVLGLIILCTLLVGVI